MRSPGLAMQGLALHATAVPGFDLDTCTDAQAMRALLQQRLPGFADGRLRIDALGVRSTRRNASRHRNPCPIAVCYELQVSDAESGRAGTQMLYAKAYRAGLSAAIYRQHQSTRLTPPAFGRALTHLADLDMVLWAWPNDPGLPQLPRLLDPAQSAGLQVELLRYEPECRATLRYSRTGAAGQGAAAAASDALYAKTFAGPRAPQVRRRFEYFWQLGCSDIDAPLVAQPLLGCSDAQTLWQAAAPGRPLLDGLPGPGAPALMRGLARALARLHDAPLALGEGNRPRPVAHWLVEVRRRQQKIVRAMPTLAARVNAVADAIAAAAGRAAPRPPALIHADFHPEQVWVHDGRIVLFDFDEFTLGDPMEDLASFVFKLEQSGADPALGATLVEASAACAPQRFDRRGLAWHLAIQALLQVSRAFVFQRPGWADVLEKRLCRCEALVAALGQELAA